MKFVYETRKTCTRKCKCKREVDAVRVVDDPEKRFPGLRLSRHLRSSPGRDLGGLCDGSLDVVVETKEPR